MLLLWLAANLSSTKISSISTILRWKILYSGLQMDMLDSGRFLCVYRTDYFKPVAGTDKL